MQTKNKKVTNKYENITKKKDVNDIEQVEQSRFNLFILSIFS